jgi:hypothetical protein
MKTELGFEVKNSIKYPDVRDKKSVFMNVKTAVCGKKAKWCMKDGCNLYCHRERD